MVRLDGQVKMEHCQAFQGNVQPPQDVLLLASEEVVSVQTSSYIWMLSEELMWQLDI